MMNIIDAHLHLFDLENGNYNWLKSEPKPNWFKKERIHKDFGEQDIELTGNITLSGFVHVEAGFDNEQPWRELEWLESECKLPFRSIAGIDFGMVPSEFGSNFDRLKKCSSFAGVRFIMEEEPEKILLNKCVVQNLKTLGGKSLVVELQINFAETKSLSSLLSNLGNRNCNVVFNHCGFPPNDLSSKDGSKWLGSLDMISKYKNTYIKCSGWEMFETRTKQDWQRRIVESVVASFGYERVMLGSNFPLCLFSQSYQCVWENYLGEVSTQINSLVHDNVKRVYRFE